jgi:carbonic anhydrase
MQSDVTVFEILVSAIATPKRKALIRYRGRDYTVKNFKFADPDELIHEVECYPLEGE